MFIIYYLPIAVFVLVSILTSSSSSNDAEFIERPFRIIKNCWNVGFYTSDIILCVLCSKTSYDVLPRWVEFVVCGRFLCELIFELTERYQEDRLRVKKLIWKSKFHTISTTNIRRRYISNNWIISSTSSSCIIDKCWKKNVRIVVILIFKLN